MLETQRAKFEADLREFKKQAWSRVESEEKERRVDIMRERIGRRMLNTAIIRGWSSWLAAYELQCHVRECRVKAADHVKRSSLIGGFSTWWRLWDAIRRAKLKLAEQEMRRHQQLEADYQTMKVSE